MTAPSPDGPGGSVAALVDPTDDHHVHSTFSDDARSTPEENLAAARDRGLRSIRMVDHVRTTTTYVPEFLAAVAALPAVDGLSVVTGVEAKILDTAGTVDAPPDVLARVGGPDGPGRVLLADHQLPGPDGPLSPRAARELLDGGMARSEPVEMLVTAYLSAVEGSGPSQLAHPFSILPKIGLTEDEVTDEHLTALADAALAHDLVVEVNEKWSCPGPRIVATLAGRGVRLIASSDAHHADDVGRYSWLRGSSGGLAGEGAR
ncbi:PHP domain-containing protein [Nocardioides sp. YIM 152588]|uniref:PHP domain-containing protein n=1 Tax=Nocardioides sp. YIM 152588 TaxID=3158259 RepID=UPI0032E46D6B